MRLLRLPLPLPRSLRFPSLAESFVASQFSLAKGPESTTSAPGRWYAGIVPVRIIFEGSVRLSQLFRIPPCVLAPLSDPGPAPMHLACVPFRWRLILCMAVLSPLVQTGGPERNAVFRGFSYAALTLAPYASCAPYGSATQCSLPSGCQPFSGGCISPLGIDYMFHFPFVVISHVLFAGAMN